MKYLKMISIVLALIFTMTFMIAGCGSSATQQASQETKQVAQTTAQTAQETSKAVEESFDASKYPLGFVCWIKGHPVVQIMETGFLNRAKELGYPAELLVPDEADLAKAVSMGEVGIAKGDKGMIIFILDPSIKALIKKAADAGIKVVTGQTVVKKDEYPGLLAWVACDAEKYGRDAADAIGKEVGGKGTVAITEGSFNTTENASAASFKAQMNKNYPDIKVLDPIEEGFDQAIAVSRATALVQANKDIVGAFSTTGGGPSTWAGAQDQTNKKLVCIGMDYSRQNLDLVKAGKIYAVIAQPLFEEFSKCVDLLDQLLRGKEVSFDNPMDAPLVTNDNIDQYYELLKKVDEAFANK
jgi:ribose transport system substrate-binding protein